MYRGSRRKHSAEKSSGGRRLALLDRVLPARDLPFHVSLPKVNSGGGSTALLYCCFSTRHGAQFIALCSSLESSRRKRLIKDWDALRLLQHDSLTQTCKLAGFINLFRPTLSSFWRHNIYSGSFLPIPKGG